MVRGTSVPPPLKGFYDLGVDMLGGRPVYFQDGGEGVVWFDVDKSYWRLGSKTELLSKKSEGCVIALLSSRNVEWPDIGRGKWTIIDGGEFLPANVEVESGLPLEPQVCLSVYHNPIDVWRFQLIIDEWS